MVADFYATTSAYVDHLLPIWHALPEVARGRWFCTPRMRAYVAAGGVAPGSVAHGRASGGDGAVVVVASGGDLQHVKTRRAVLVEHGAGQSYGADFDHPSYSGGRWRDNVVLFLTPNEVSAGRNRERYPSAAHEVIGSPRLDALMTRRPRHAERPTAVVLSAHFDCRLSPESRWALPHYEAALPGLVTAFRRLGIEVLGHGHPRFAVYFRQLWSRMGVEHVADFASVADRGWLYVSDNSSTMYEWAALGRPVLVLNAPWYRRYVDLWPRFWRCADVGVQVEEADELVDLAGVAYSDTSRNQAARRRAISDEVYPLRDGGAAHRGADAICALL